MNTSSGIICKVCDKGEIVVLTKYHQTWEPVTWREHFFGQLYYLESLVDRRNIIQKLFKRIKRPRNTHTTTNNHCNVCGVKYAFVPAQNLEIPKSSDSMVQISPHQWMAKKS